MCQREFEEHGLEPCVAQCNVSFNGRRGTLRGMHFKPRRTARPSWCVHARRHLRRDHRPAAGLADLSREWFGVELTAENRRTLYIPEGFAHGFQTLEDDTEVFYQMSSSYVPEPSAGVRWNDPAFGIAWPIEPPS